MEITFPYHHVINGMYIKGIKPNIVPSYYSQTNCFYSWGAMNDIS